MADDFTVNFTDPDDDDTYTGTLSVMLEEDEVGEATGDIKLTLNTDPDSGHTYRLSTEVEGTITILDNDAPELTITGGDPVTEAVGAMATFTVSAKVSPNDMITIYYTASDDSGGADFLDTEGADDTMLDFRSNALEASFMIAIASDTVEEGHGTISVELTADQTTPAIKYTVGTPRYWYS